MVANDSEEKQVRNAKSEILSRQSLGGNPRCLEFGDLF